MHPDFAPEKERFEMVIKYMKGYYARICDDKSSIGGRIEEALKHYNSDNIDQFTELTLNTSKYEFLEQKVRDVGRSLGKPYFARVDFMADVDAGEMSRVYIGKFTLFDDMGSILITDWRAPISTLYYEGRVGRASYDCEEGMIGGEITLKRQYISDAGELLDIMDIDITTNDEFLQAALGSSKDNRLKDIVTTIQAEQNQIIRADMFSPLIVQGAAGSGKTTIALHRIAYLLYAHEDNVRPKNIMIMAPNKFFLSYISDVLPDLGVDNVVQTTFDDFAIEFIGKRIKIKAASDILADVVERVPEATKALRVSSLKSTMGYKKLIERYYEFCLERLIPDEDFDVEGYVVISKERVYEYILKDYSYLPLKKRVGELKKNLDSALKREKERLLNFIDKKYEAKRGDIKKKMEDCSERRKIITQILDERDRKITDLKKIIQRRTRAYLEGFKIIPADQLYAGLIRNVKLFKALAKGIFTDEESQDIQDITLSYIEAGYVETDDITGILYLHNKMIGAEERTELKHVVIDEAQDYSTFQFSVLREILGIGSFSILGDLNQGIYSYRGVKDWEDVGEGIFGKTEYMSLEQSYRTTIEIMDKANGVIDALYKQGISKGIKKARPVIRHGEEVSVEQKLDLIETAAAIDMDIKRYRQDGLNSIAIICKTRNGCETLGKLLKPKPKTISAKDKEYTGGVLLTPSYLVKGLEFDAVIIADATAENYSCDELDIKLLYIAMTRALHRLGVYYCGEISPLLTPLL